MNRADKLAASERFDSEAVAQQLEVQGVEARAFASNAALFDALTDATLKPDAVAPRVVVFFTNGSFDGIISRFAQAAGQAV